MYTPDYINVTVNTSPINVNVVQNPPINVNVSSQPSNILVGIQGVQGLPGSSTISSGVNFSYNIPSGNNSYAVSFPNSFSQIPAIQATLDIPSGVSDLYAWATQNITTGGFSLVFSDVIQESGLILNVKCN